MHRALLPMPMELRWSGDSCRSVYDSPRGHFFCAILKESKKGNSNVRDQSILHRWQDDQQEHRNWQMVDV